VAVPEDLEDTKGAGKEVMEEGEGVIM